jgi:YcxB-like protein
MASMEHSEVTVEYQYTEAEYLAASRLLFFSLPSVFVRLIVFGLLVLSPAAMLSVVVTDLFPLWAIVAFVILLEGGLFYNLLVRMPRAYFRGDAKFRDKYSVTFSDEGIKVKTSQLDSKLAWSLYTRVLEGRGMYLLVYGKDTRMMTAVPKRAFKNRDQENQFRELVARHITDHAALKQISSVETEYRPTSFTPPDWR